MGTSRETPAEGNEGALHLGPERPRVYSDLSPEEKERYNADIQETNILLQGLPKDIYTLINHYTDAKDIWDNVKTLLEGSELTKKTVNHNYMMTLNTSVSTKEKLFTTIIFVTVVKLNRGLRDSNYDQLYAYLKQHEAYANENKMMVDRIEVRGTMHEVSLVMRELGTELGMQIQVKQGRLSVTTATADDCDAFDSDVDEAPTAQTMFMANLSSADPIYDEASLSYDSNILSEVPDHENYQDAVCEHHEVHEMHANVQPHYVFDSHTDYANDSNMIPYDQTSSNPRNQATIQDDMVVVQNVQGRQTRGHGNNALGACAASHGGVQNTVGYTNLEYFKDKMLLMQAQENEVALDEEQLLFIVGGQDNAFDEDVDKHHVQDLALNVDNVFQAGDCDAFDSDVDEAPTTQTMFMANLSSADPVCDEACPSYDSDILSRVHDDDHYQDDVCERHE
nr:hypothetical protein [Tanacetum cinerariifolium]